MRPRSKAIVLALFLGGVGAHWFYLNRPALGCLHVLFCWTCLPSLLAAASAVDWLRMTDERFERRVVRGEGGTTVAERVKAIRWSDAAYWVTGVRAPKGYSTFRVL